MTDDQKPMSAEEKARHVASTWINNLSDEVSEPDKEQLEHFVTLALREHAAEAVEAEREACAAIADKWGRGEWRVKQGERSRFDITHLQTQVNCTGRAIAEDIRARTELDAVKGDGDAG